MCVCAREENVIRRRIAESSSFFAPFYFFLFFPLRMSEQVLRSIITIDGLIFSPFFAETVSLIHHVFHVITFYFLLSNFSPSKRKNSENLPEYFHLLECVWNKMQQLHSYHHRRSRSTCCGAAKADRRPVLGERKGFPDGES